MEKSFNLKSWWNLLLNQKESDYLTRAVIYENSIKNLPYSFKLWFNYLYEAREFAVNSSNIFIERDEIYLIVNNLHERALSFLYKFPTIWCDYIEFLIYQNKISNVVKVFNKSLQTLPITKHELLWKIYFPWSLNLNIKHIGINSYERYLKINPSIRDDYIEYLIEIKHFEKALDQIKVIINEEIFKYDKHEDDYWEILIDIVTNNELNINHFDLIQILRNGIGRYSKRARIYITMANLHLKSANYDEARSIFEEGIMKIDNKKDFTLIFNSYLNFEELYIKQILSNKENQAVPELVDDDTNLVIKLNPFARINSLLNRRPFLLSDIEIRKNPNNTQNLKS